MTFALDYCGRGWSCLWRLTPHTHVAHDWEPSPGTYYADRPWLWVRDAPPDDDRPEEINHERDADDRQD
jgi:hypothetical protein